MQSQEQQLIDGLFARLRQAEQQSETRDAEAQRHIESHLAKQPAAPYYMAQAIIVQEAALKRLEARVRSLEGEVETLRNGRAQGSGSFLSGLFGGASAPAATAPNADRGWREPAPSAPAAAMPGRGSGFLGGALQTAAGVAGGMMVGNLLMNLFDHHRPEEIVEVIEQPPLDNSLSEQRWQDGSGYDDDMQDASFDDYQDDFDDDGFI